jgi:hypothetical protein
MRIALAHQLQQANIIDFPPPSPLQGKSNEWYTPSRYIEAARQVMGSIDLDPASCELANRTVKAKRYFIERENGLAQEWYGNIWLNPPYGLDKSLPNEQRSTIGKWVNRLIHFYSVGDIEQAILLTTCQVNSAWFDLLWQHPICFPKQKIRFYLPHGSTSKPRLGHNFDSHMFGSVLVYLGPHEQRFIEVFQQFGTIAKRVSMPRHTVSKPSLWSEVES